MSDSDPTPPPGAFAAGRVVEVLGFLICAAAVGLLVLEIVLGSATIAGVVLVIFVAIAGAATVVTGRAIERSRAR